MSFSKEAMATGKGYDKDDMSEFPSEEAPGAGVSFKDGTGDSIHTSSCHARGGDIVIGDGARPGSLPE